MVYPRESIWSLPMSTLFAIPPLIKLVTFRISTPLDSFLSVSLVDLVSDSESSCRNHDVISLSATYLRPHLYFVSFDSSAAVSPFPFYSRVCIKGLCFYFLVRFIYFVCVVFFSMVGEGGLNLTLR